MTEPVFNVLFLCTGNTARSVLAEGILRKDGAGRFRSFSAVGQPLNKINPFALKTLAAHGYPAEGYRSKSWDEFAGSDAPKMDFVFTVCDSAAGEAFEKAFQYMRNRISAFVQLPVSGLDAMSLQKRLKEIGDMEGRS